MRSGLIPSWATDPKIGFSSFNARTDSLDTKLALKAAWAKSQRCLIVTDGFYVWKSAGAVQSNPEAQSVGTADDVICRSRVGNVKNAGAELAEPLTAGSTSLTFSSF
jgi:hypothetical protein